MIFYSDYKHLLFKYFKLSMHTASTILFVDDEKHETKYFKKALSHTFDIEVADSVNSAIEILDEKHQHIAVVITDQRMPKQLGIELLQYTQNHYPDIVRILTTAFCDSKSAISAINKAEVFRYITKPWNLDQLEEALHQALKRYHSSQKNTGSALENSLLEEFKDDCEHWLMYAIHAYGDEDVYRNGIEALACRYNVLINNQFEINKAKNVSQKVDKILSRDFLSEAIIKDLQSQTSKGFGVTQTNTKRH